MHVTICIVAFRNLPDIRVCLAALAQTSHGNFEVLICENGGSDAYRTLTDALPTALPGGQPITYILADGNTGYAGGVNICMRARSDADAWWIVNPDAEPDAAALSKLLERLKRGDVDAVGGTLYLSDGTVQAHGGHWRPFLARPESIGHGSPLDGSVDPDAVERQMNYLLGASMLIGRGFVERVGLMREDYFLYCEEVEWCLRAITAGATLGFAPGARILHNQGATTGSAHAITHRPRLPIYLDERNKLNVVRDSTPWRLPIAIPASFVLLFLRFGRRRAWRQWGHALAGWWAGIRNERGVPAFLP